MEALERSTNHEAAVGDLEFTDRVLVLTSALLNDGHGSANAPAGLKVAQQDDAIGEIGDVYGRLHIADQPVLGDRQERGRALPVEIRRSSCMCKMSDCSSGMAV